MTKKEVVKTITPAVAPITTDELIIKGVANVLKAIETKKKILQQLEEINELLEKYGVDSDSTDSTDSIETVKVAKQELTEANVLSFLGDSSKSKGDLVKQFKGKLETIVSFLDGMESKGLLTKKDKQGLKKTAIHYFKK
ncbi:MAG: hypothetical protein WCH62_08110 [Candidatus Omnitrophota bacterium]